jgi:hypothetical protein
MTITTYVTGLEAREYIKRYKRPADAPELRSRRTVALRRTIGIAIIFLNIINATE